MPSPDGLCRPARTRRRCPLRTETHRQAPRGDALQTDGLDGHMLPRACVKSSIHMAVRTTAELLAQPGQWEGAGQGSTAGVLA